MDDPYIVLGLAADCTDEAIRARYLELVRQFSPEHHPQKFAAIRSAYEQLRDLNTRIRFRLFEAGKKDSLDAILEEIECQSPRRRVTLKQLVTNLRKP